MAFLLISVVVLIKNKCQLENANQLSAHGELIKDNKQS